MYITITYNQYIYIYDNTPMQFYETFKSICLQKFIDIFKKNISVLLYNFKCIKLTSSQMNFLL